MLPILRAAIVYPDGSKYWIPDDGTWAEAPPFGVQAVVYYHEPPLKTVDGGGSEGIYYYQADEFAGTDVKLGLFIDGDTYYRIMDLATKSVEP
jgi:hypothetical protein